MENVAKGLVGIAVLGFVLAVVAVFVGPIMGISPEGFSRTCNNLALVAIALMMMGK